MGTPPPASRVMLLYNTVFVTVHTLLKFSCACRSDRERL